MEPPTTTTVTRIRARYAETDQMGIVHHANYYVWMEVARVELCQAMGVRYRDMEAEGVLLAVIGTECRYISPVRFDEDVEIKTCIAKASARGVSFAYEVSCAGRHVASGETRHIFLNREMKPSRLPRPYWPIFGLT